METQAMQEFKDWLRQNLFLNDFFNREWYQDEVIVFARRAPYSLVEDFVHKANEPVPFSREQLFRAVMKTCGQHRLERNAIFFHIQVHDNCAFTIPLIEKRPYPPRQMPLFEMYEKLQDVVGTTYCGLLGQNKDWLLLFEHEKEIRIDFFADGAVCDTLRRELKVE